jgi:hypothetical protein
VALAVLARPFDKSIGNLKMKLVTIAALARHTGISYHLASRIVEEGEIPSVTIGVRKMISESAVQEWHNTIRAIAESPLRLSQGQGHVFKRVS